MRNRFSALQCWGLSIAIAIFMGGCTSVEVKDDTEAKAKKEFVTGSNLPQRDRSKSGVVNADADALERARQSATAQSLPRGN
jgi:uncharacterized protein YceK